MFDHIVILTPKRFLASLELMQSGPLLQSDFPALRQERRNSKQPHKEFVVTASHEAILDAVYRFQLLTAEQVRVACGYSKNSLERVQRLLKQLSDKEYLLSGVVPTTKAKSPYYYTLAHKGRHYLQAAGKDVHAYFRPHKEREKGYLFLSHTLSLNDVLIAASLLHKHTPAYSLFALTHERVLKHTPYKVTVNHFDGKEETITLIPDALLEFHHTKDSGKHSSMPVLYEHDMGTIEQRNFRKKIRAYIHLIKSGRYKDLFNTKAIMIAFGAANKDKDEHHAHKRVALMREWTRKECAATSEPKWLTDLFFFRALPADLHPAHVWLAPHWYLPFDDTTPRTLLTA